LPWIDKIKKGFGSWPQKKRKKNILRCTTKLGRKKGKEPKKGKKGSRRGEENRGKNITGPYEKRSRFPIAAEGKG